MNKKKLTGWKNVFSFTFAQSLKSKSFITNTILTVVIFFAVTFGVNVYSAMKERDRSSESIESSQTEQTDQKVQNESKKRKFASTIYYSDEVGFGFSMEEVNEAVNKKYDGVTLIPAQKDREAMTNDIKSADAESAYLVIGAGEEGMEVSVLLPEITKYSEEQAEKFGKTVKKYIESWKETGLQLSEEQKNFLNAEIRVAVAGDKSESPVEMAAKQYVPMAFCLILYMSIVLYGQMVGNSVAEEKTSKVMELLLTSIRPLAVIVGKILSMMCLAMIQLGINIAALLAGNAVGTVVGQNLSPTYSNTIMSVMQEYNLMSVFSPVRLLCAFFVFILGFTFYCTFAGLMGATVNRGEDLASAMSVYTSISMVGFMLAYLPNVLGTVGKGVQTFAAIFPLSSPFILPARILLADMSNGMIGAAIGVLAVLVIVFAWMVSKIYEMVILYNGNKISMKQMIKFFKDAKTVA